MPKFLAVYTGTPPGPDAGPPSAEVIAKGMKAWQNWMEQHASQIVDAGGPLGATKKASKAGVTDTKNNLSGYVIVEAASHDAAARLFENHPHFSIFPGEAVEIMTCPPIPTMD